MKVTGIGNMGQLMQTRRIKQSKRRAEPSQLRKYINALQQGEYTEKESIGTSYRSEALYEMG